MTEGLLALVFTVVGVAAKSMWDQYMARLSARQGLASQARIRHLEAQLSQLYWPLYTRLMRDNALWEILKRRGDDDPERALLAATLEREIILPNHAAMLTIIEGNLHLAAGDAEVLAQIQRYVQHVAVFQAMRAAGVQHRDPIELGLPWPGNLFGAIERRAMALQAEYNALLAEGSK